MAYFELPSLLCRFANQGYAAYHGQTPESMLNRSVEEAIGTRAWLAIAPYVERSKRGERVKYTREQTRPNGEIRMIEVHLIPHMASTPEPVGCFVLITDITERWRADQAMRQTEERMRKFSDRLCTARGSGPVDLPFHQPGISPRGAGIHPQRTRGPLRSEFSP